MADKFSSIEISKIAIRRIVNAAPFTG